MHTKSLVKNLGFQHKVSLRNHFGIRGQAFMFLLEMESHRVLLAHCYFHWYQWVGLFGLSFHFCAALLRNFFCQFKLQLELS